MSNFSSKALILSESPGDAEAVAQLTPYSPGGSNTDLLTQNPDLLSKVAALKVADGAYWVSAQSDDHWSLAAVANALPPGVYDAEDMEFTARQIAAWALAQYDFNAHLGSDVTPQKARGLIVTDAQKRRQAQAITDSIWLARDLINQPANLLGPAQLAHAARAVADHHGASCKLVDGDTLAQEFPAVHAVGMAAAQGREPCVIDMRWKNANNAGPKITLVGKGVCYDTGGLNLKPGNFMRNMKKDMGGSAHVLALANLIMGLGLPVQLRVIIGAAENSVAGNSFRPGDVIKTRAGKSVEIGNTDAEGRLVLADCLTLAQEDETPDLLIDFATLTGAARVALGTAMPAVFSNKQALANELVDHGMRLDDPLWSLPLYRPYADRLKSNVADLGNIAEGERYGDAIMAALFLDHFVDAKCPWLHVDCFAWNLETKPGRPKGGDVQALLATLALIEARLVRAG